MMYRLSILAAFVILSLGAICQTPFTYQGKLVSGGSPVNSATPVSFKLYDALTGGTQVGSTIAQSITPSNGLFTTNLDFGSLAFSAANRFLEITVNGTVLTPRQPLTPAPFAYSLVLPFAGSTTNGDAINVITTNGINGVYGESDAVNGNGVTGVSPAVGGYAIYGYATDPSGIGVYGSHASSSGVGGGVQGVTNSTSTGAVGVYGGVLSTSPGVSSAAVKGENLGTTGNGIGVWGSHAGSGYGVYGTSPSGTGVYGYSSSGQGIVGEHNSTSGTLPGVKGITNSTAPNASGVYGVLTSTSPGSISAGVRGDSLGTSSAGIGVMGYHAGSGWGVYGISAAGIGVYGYSTSGTGVYALSSSGDALHAQAPVGAGVFGEHTGTTGVNPGVKGTSNSTTDVAFAVYGVMTSTSSGQYSAAIRGENLGTNSNGIGVWGTHASGYGVLGSSTTGLGVYAYGTGTASSNGAGLYCSGNFQQIYGAFKASPTTTQWTTNKPATVKLHDGTQVKLFAEEAAEIYFNDYGVGQLQNGRAHIVLDKKFAQTVTIDEAHPMMVFVQLEGDSDGVFVTNKTNSGFDVIERHNGTSTCNFSYRIVCKRKYYEDERLATQDEDISFNTRMLNQVWPEQMEQARQLPVQGQSPK